MLLSNVWFQKKSIPTVSHGRSLEIPRGRGVLKAKFLEAMYENKLEFLGGGCKTKYGYFLELHNQTIGTLMLTCHVA